MKIYSADTWTLDKLQEQVADAGRRILVVPAADSKKAVLETFSEVLDFPEEYGVDLDALNDSLHDFADSVTDNGDGPVTVLWQTRRSQQSETPSAAGRRPHARPAPRPGRPGRVPRAGGGSSGDAGHGPGAVC